MIARLLNGFRRVVDVGEPGSLRFHMIIGTVGTSGARAAHWGISGIAAFVLANLLEPKGYGDYAYAVSWIGVLGTLSGLGLGALTTREVAAARATENWSALKGVLRWSTRVVSSTSIAVAILAGALLWLLRESMDPATRDALWLAVAAIPFVALSRLWEGSLWGMGRIVQAQLPSALVPGVAVVFAFVLVPMFGQSGVAGTTAYWVAVVAACAILFWLLQYHVRGTGRSDVHFEYSRTWLASILPMTLIATANVLNTQVGILLLGSLSGAEPTGQFDLARKLATFVHFVLMAVQMPLRPALAELYARQERDRLQRLVTRSTRIAMLGALPVLVVLLGLGEWLLGLAGPEFPAAFPALVILCVGQIVNVAAGSVLELLTMTGYERLTAKGLVLSLLLNVALGALLIPIWGIVGAAIATAVSMMAWNVYLAIRIRVVLGIDSTGLGLRPN